MNRNNKKAVIYRTAHKYSIRNWEALTSKEQMCGCFSCCRIFPSSELTDKLPEMDGQYTAWCHYCGVDSIIGESSGFPITEYFIKKMHDYWF